MFRPRIATYSTNKSNVGQLLDILASSRGSITSRMSDKETLASLLGSYDNLDEPIPLSNRLETILGVSISLQVRTRPPVNLRILDIRSDTAPSRPIKVAMCRTTSDLFACVTDLGLDMWAFTTMDTFPSNQEAWMG